MLSLSTTPCPASGPEAAPLTAIFTYHPCSGSSSALGRRHSERPWPGGGGASGTASRGARMLTAPVAISVNSRTSASSTDRPSSAAARRTCSSVGGRISTSAVPGEALAGEGVDPGELLDRAPYEVEPH